jgi:hypothetical protein
MSAAHTLTIDRALRDDKLLGAALGDAETWSVWIAVLKAVFGLPLDGEQLLAFADVSDGRLPPTSRVSEFWAVAGRRSGKSRMAGALAAYLGAFQDWSDKLAPGEPGFIQILSPTVAQARLIADYALTFLQESPILKRKVVNANSTEIRLEGNITIAAHPNSFRSVCGRSLLCAILDESAFFRSEESALPDVETYRALLPALATTNGLLVGISSPYAKRGLLYDRHKLHFGQDGDVLVVQGASHLQPDHRPDRRRPRDGVRPGGCEFRVAWRIPN